MNMFGVHANTVITLISLSKYLLTNSTQVRHNTSIVLLDNMLSLASGTMIMDPINAEYVDCNSSTIASAGRPG